MVCDSMDLPIILFLNMAQEVLDEFWWATASINFVSGISQRQRILRSEVISRLGCRKEGKGSFSLPYEQLLLISFSF